jgi:acetate kinase
MRILTINCGSSSLKASVLDVTVDHPPGLRAPVIASGGVRTIGGDAHLEVSFPGEERASEPIAVADHGDAASRLLGELVGRGLLDELSDGAVGHRVVHGGHQLVAPTPIDDSVLEFIEQAEGLAPLHNKAAAQAIRAVRAALGPEVTQVAVFDTAFHHDLPERAARYPIPRALTERHRIRRFGFHGLAHRWMSERYAARAGVDPAAIRMITLQLGNGCSAAAIDGGRSIDTTMGFTPLEGLMMATRSGDIDPALVGFLARRERVDVEEVERWLNHDSGVLGVSGRSGSLRVLLGSTTREPDSGLAIEMFCYRVRKCIGAYLAALGGADAIVFGGGVGESQPEIRERICGGLSDLGVVLDSERNAGVDAVEATISGDRSRVRIEVLPVDEATVLARDTVRCVAARAVS